MAKNPKSAPRLSDKHFRGPLSPDEESRREIFRLQKKRYAVKPKRAKKPKPPPSKSIFGAASVLETAAKK